MYIQVFIKAKFAIKSVSRDYSDFYFRSLGFDFFLTFWLSYIRYYTVDFVIEEKYYIIFKLGTTTSSYIQIRDAHSNSRKWKAKEVNRGGDLPIMFWCSIYFRFFKAIRQSNNWIIYCNARGSNLFWNIGTHLQDSTVSHP